MLLTRCKACDGNIDIRGFFFCESWDQKKVPDLLTWLGWIAPWIGLLVIFFQLWSIFCLKVGRNQGIRGGKLHRTCRYGQLAYLHQLCSGTVPQRGRLIYRGFWGKHNYRFGWVGLGILVSADVSKVTTTWAMFIANGSCSSSLAVEKFQNRKPIGEIGCCESQMSEQKQWLIELSNYLADWLTRRLTDEPTKLTKPV